VSAVVNRRKAKFQFYLDQTAMRALLFLVSLPALFQISCGSSGYSNGSTNVPPAVVTVTLNTVDAVPGGAGAPLHISVTNDLPSDALSVSVTISPACGGNPCCCGVSTGQIPWPSALSSPWTDRPA